MTAEELRKLLDYKKETGRFFWIQTPRSHRRRAGEIAGSVHHRGYRVIFLLGRSYAEHRLVWLWMTGKWPKNSIDHINGTRDDNRWKNLRDVPIAVNSQNQRVAQARNKTGFLGVKKKRGKFDAQIAVSGKCKYLGTFSTPEKAHAAYVKAKRELHPGCTI